MGIDNLEKYNIFSDSLESYYWLGFLFADGHFYKKRSISLEVSINDLHHLEKFKSFTGSDNKISTIERTNVGMFKTAVVTTVSFNITDTISIGKLCDLFEIKSNKTYRPPIIRTSSMTDDQFLALIIGFIDGDGCIRKRNKHTLILNIKVHKNWLDNLKIIEENLRKITQIKFKDHMCKIIKDHKTNTEYAKLEISKRNILKYLKIFANNNKLPILKRKWDLVDENNCTKEEFYTNYVVPLIKELRDNENMKFGEIKNVINHKFNLNLTRHRIQYHYNKSNEMLSYGKNYGK
jgi:hypothetical protein